jgi:hypothetical protein
MSLLGARRIGSQKRATQVMDDILSHPQRGRNPAMQHCQMTRLVWCVALYPHSISVQDEREGCVHACVCFAFPHVFRGSVPVLYCTCILVEFLACSHGDLRCVLLLSLRAVPVVFTLTNESTTNESTTNESTGPRDFAALVWWQTGWLLACGHMNRRFWLV